MAEFFSAEFFNELLAFCSRHMFMSGAWLVVLVMLIAVQFKLSTARVKKASSNIAVLLVNKENGVFVDIRPADRFSSGHIANSVNVTAGDIKSGRISRIERSKDCPVILVGKDKFDTECFNSARTLKKSGFSKVYILDGGILEWSNQNLPLSTKK